MRRILRFNSVRLGVFAAAAAVLAVVLVSGAPASTTVTIGQTGTTTTACNALSAAQTAVASGNGYVVPAGSWEISNWSTQANDSSPYTITPSPASMAAVVFRPTTPGHYTVISESPVQALTPGVLNTFTLASPLAAQGGDILGLWSSDGTGCAFPTGNAADTSVKAHGAIPAVNASASLTTSIGSYRLNISATLAPALTTVGFFNQLSHGGPSFVGTGPVGSSNPVTVYVCASSVSSCSSSSGPALKGTATTNNGGFSGAGQYWTAGWINGPMLVVGTTYVAQAYQAGVPGAPFTFTETVGDGTSIAITNGAGSVAGTPDAGDTITASFTDPLNPATICSGFSATAAGPQTITGATLTLTSSSGGDILSATSPSGCTGVGTVTSQMGFIYVKGQGPVSSATFSSSTITWDPTTSTLTLTLGGTPGGSNGGIFTGVPINFPVYNFNCSDGLQDIAGNLIPNCFNNINSFPMSTLPTYPAPVASGY